MMTNPTDMMYKTAEEKISKKNSTNEKLSRISKNGPQKKRQANNDVTADSGTNGKAILTVFLI